MENIITVNPRTKETVIAEVRATIDQVNETAILGTIKIGKNFNELKELVPHGEWMNYIEEHIGFSARKVQQCIQMSDNYGNEGSQYYKIISNANTCADLSYSKALRLLAVPEEDVESFVENNDISDMTVKDLEAKIAEIKKEKEDLEQDNQSLKTNLQKANLEMSSLATKVTDAEEELSKIESVDGLSDEALQEIREKQEEIDKLLSDLDKSKLAKAKLEEKISRSAEENEKLIETTKAAAAAEALSKIEEAKAQAREEVESELQDAKTNIEKLSKELSAAGNEDVLKIKLMVADIQRIYESCNATMVRMDNGLGGKMQSYLKAVLVQLIERMDD